jgi:hypothetical protein
MDWACDIAGEVKKTTQLIRGPIDYACKPTGGHNDVRRVF